MSPGDLVRIRHWSQPDGPVYAILVAGDPEPGGDPVRRRLGRSSVVRIPSGAPPAMFLGEVRADRPDVPPGADTYVQVLYDGKIVNVMTIHVEPAK